jgi:hypothetical protein
VQANGEVILKAKTSEFTGGVIRLDADENVTVEAQKSITFQVGESRLVLSQQGVSIKAPFITQAALVKAETVASIVDIAATMQISINSSVMTSIVAAGMVRVAGTGVLIN